MKSPNLIWWSPSPTRWRAMPPRPHRRHRRPHSRRSSSVQGSASANSTRAFPAGHATAAEFVLQCRPRQALAGADGASAMRRRPRAGGGGAEPVPLEGGQGERPRAGGGGRGAAGRARRRTRPPVSVSDGQARRPRDRPRSRRRSGPARAAMTAGRGLGTDSVSRPSCRQPHRPSRHGAERRVGGHWSRLRRRTLARLPRCGRPGSLWGAPGPVPGGCSASSSPIRPRRALRTPTEITLPCAERPKR